MTTENQSAVNAHIELLGKRVKDKVTEFEGVASSICFDLYGCVQVAISPKVKEGKIESPGWFDAARLEVIDDKKVMDPPDFHQDYIAEGKKGSAEKPEPNL